MKGDELDCIAMHVVVTDEARETGNKPEGVSVYLSSVYNGAGCGKKKQETQPPMGGFPPGPRLLNNNDSRG